MDSTEEILKFKIYARTAFDSTGNIAFVANDSTLISQPANDFYIPLLLTKTCNIYEYVDTKKDDKIYTIERQDINPYFIEFSFFDTIKRIKVNNGEDLTQSMISNIKAEYEETKNMDYTAVTEWFNYIGRNIFAVKKEVDGTTLDDFESSISGTTRGKTEDVVSKAMSYPITINK